MTIKQENFLYGCCWYLQHASTRFLGLYVLRCILLCRSAAFAFVRSLYQVRTNSRPIGVCRLCEARTSTVCRIMLQDSPRINGVLATCTPGYLLLHERAVSQKRGALAYVCHLDKQCSEKYSATDKHQKTQCVCHSHFLTTKNKMESTPPCFFYACVVARSLLYIVCLSRERVQEGVSREQVTQLMIELPSFVTRPPAERDEIGFFLGEVRRPPRRPPHPPTHPILCTRLPLRRTVALLRLAFPLQ